MKICDASHFFIKRVNMQHEVSSQRYCQQAPRAEERSDAHANKKLTEARSVGIICTGKRASSLWCGLHLQSEIDAGLWAGALAGNRKPDCDAVERLLARWNCASADDRKTSHIREKLCIATAMQNFSRFFF